MLSFVIPAKNEEKYICECLRSIYRQPSPESFEIIVVDNNSTDATVEKVRREYPEVRVVSEAIVGTNPARQAGYAESAGDTLIFLDADVRLPPGWLVRVRRKLEEEPEAVALSGPYKFYDFSKSLQLIAGFYFFIMYIWGKLGPIFLGYMPSMMAGNMVIKKTALRNAGGLNTDLKFYGDDTDTAKRLGRTGKALFDLNLWVYSSARRFKSRGILHSVWHYVVNHFWLLVRGKPKDSGIDTESAR